MTGSKQPHSQVGGVSLCCVSRSQENVSWPWKVPDTDREDRVAVHSRVQLSRRQGQPTTRLAVSAQPCGTESGESGSGSECTGAAPGCPGYSQFSGLSHFNEKSLMHVKSASQGEGRSRSVYVAGGSSQPFSGEVEVFYGQMGKLLEQSRVQRPRDKIKVNIGGSG